MCGIIGYVGNDVLLSQTVEMLEKLEYRGYDSAGVAFLKDNQIETIKSVGKISELKSKIDNNIFSNCIVGHTRWATHGKPSIENSHPHCSFDNKWCIVHNGIIENFSELKQDIVNKNNKIIFKSQTDSEVFANLLTLNQNLGPLKNIVNCCEKVKGSFAFAIINSEVPNTIFLAKRNSPLYVAQNSNECFVASDPVAFVGKAKSFFCLNDDEFCVLEKNNCKFYDKKLNLLNKNAQMLSIDKKEAQLNGYEHFMLKEIEESPKVIKDINLLYQQQNILKRLNKINLNKINKIKIIGCGTAYHSGLIGAYYLKKSLKIEVEVCLASEFRYSKPLIDKQTLCIFVSQSGETADTIGALELSNKKAKITLAITNVLHSTVANKSNIVLPLFAGPEIAVASTKAYVAQCYVFYLLSQKLKLLKNNKKQNNIFLSKNALNLSRKTANIIEKCKKQFTEQFVKNICKFEKIFFIGRSYDYFTCLEASLKLKEISYINCWGIAAGELKHGTIALIESNTLIVVILTDVNIAKKTINAIQQVKSRGAKILLITNFKSAIEQLDENDFYVFIKNDKDFLPIISVLSTQLLAYYVSCAKGINPDKPRNLAKSVTVE